MFYIYKITNKINKKCYIGFTHNPKKRFANHKNSIRLNRPLYNSMKKHGIDNFEFEVIYENENKDHVLFDMEPYFINKHNSYMNGYNCTKGGEDTNSLETRKKNSDRMRHNNPMTKLRVNNGSFRKGHKPKITAERNEKISKNMKGSLNPNFGNKNAASHMNVLMYCNHCNKSVSKGNYYRWHHSNCKGLIS